MSSPIPIDYFAPLQGQSRAVVLLSQAVQRQVIAPAYLFVGPGGIGKAIAARCWLEMIFCFGLDSVEISSTCQKIRQGNHPDILWIAPTYSHQGKLFSAAEAAAAGIQKKAPPQIRIEQVREIGQFLSQPPMVGDRALVVIEQAETMAESAANALLKTLEEPGAATLILLADQESRLLPTIVSRCQRIPFQRLSQSQMIEILQSSGHGEIVQEKILLDISQGSPGAAIELWQRLEMVPPELKKHLVERPRTIRQALLAAKQIDRELDNLAQLALLEYLQYHYWQAYHDSTLVAAVAEGQCQLLAYVQPRLVWECLLLSLLPAT